MFALEKGHRDLGAYTLCQRKYYTFIASTGYLFVNWTRLRLLKKKRNCLLYIVERIYEMGNTGKFCGIYWLSPCAWLYVKCGIITFLIFFLLLTLWAAISYNITMFWLTTGVLASYRLMNFQVDDVCVKFLIISRIQSRGFIDCDLWL